MYKVGDSVKIIKKDTLYGWNDYLCMGKIYKIMKIDSNMSGRFGIRLVVPTTIHSEGGWWVPKHCVTPTPAINEQLLLFNLV